MNVNQAVVHLVLPQDVRGEDPLYGSPASSQGASFHVPSFWLQSRVPRVILALLLLLLCGSVQALPVANEKGERIRVNSALVEGKKTVLFFHAPWSKTSGRYQVELERWQKKSDREYAVVQVDVQTLKSPVSKQFKLAGVPAFRIYDEEGKLKASGQEAFNQVTELLK